jgi:opacity protein-like surface antigen
MKKIALVMMLSLVGVASAYAENGPYIGGTVSYAVLSNSDVTDPAVPGQTDILDYNQGASAALNAGFRFGQFRLEGELGYQRNGIDSFSGTNATGELTQSTALLNAYFDMPVESKNVTPYVGIGGGSSNVKLGDFNVEGSGQPNTSSSDRVNVFHLSLGVLIPASDDLNVDLRYRYQDASDPDFDGTKFTLSGYQLSLGLQYNF